MRPSFSIWEPPMLMVFWSSTRPVYFSLDRSLFMVSQFYVSFPVGESVSFCSSPATILPRLSSLRQHSKIQQRMAVSSGLMGKSDLHGSFPLLYSTQRWKMIVKFLDSISENNVLLLSPPVYVNVPLLCFIFYPNKFF